MSESYGSLGHSPKHARDTSSRDILDIGSFLDEIGLGRFGERFQKNGITGDMLVAMQEWTVASDVGKSVGMDIGDILKLYLAAKRSNLKHLEHKTRKNNLIHENISPRDDQPVVSRGWSRNWVWVYLRHLHRFEDWLYPFDHRTEFRQKILRSSLDAKEVKKAFDHLCETWILVFSLVFNTLVGLWGMIPDDDTITTTEKIICEVAMIIGCLASFAAVILFCIFSLNLSLVSPKNVKSFLIMVCGPWVYTEFLILISNQAIMFLIMDIGYIRLRQFIPEGYIWAHVLIWIGYLSTIFIPTCMAINYISYTSVLGGLINEDRVGRKVERQCTRGKLDLGKVVNEEREVVDAISENFGYYEGAATCWRGDQVRVASVST